MSIVNESISMTALSLDSYFHDAIIEHSNSSNEDSDFDISVDDIGLVETTAIPLLQDVDEVLAFAKHVALPNIEKQQSDNDIKQQLQDLVLRKFEKSRFEKVQRVAIHQLRTDSRSPFKLSRIDLTVFSRKEILGDLDNIEVILAAARNPLISEQIPNQSINALKYFLPRSTPPELRGYSAFALTLRHTAKVVIEKHLKFDRRGRNFPIGISPQLKEALTRRYLEEFDAEGRELHNSVAEMYLDYERRAVLMYRENVAHRNYKFQSADLERDTDLIIRYWNYYTVFHETHPSLETYLPASVIELLRSGADRNEILKALRENAELSDENRQSKP